MGELPPKSAKENVLKYYDEIEKSPQDNRSFRGLQLKNRLKVLLVSDPTTDKSAAALDVNVGFLSDPDELPGLAHFCEHMLFMGTTKYPQENGYNKYLSEHGGTCNACTCSDYTRYYFDILPEFLSGALDIFSQFFISPLFTESSTSREILAVNSEHEKNICTDVNRLDQLDRLICDQSHPHSKFGTGNKKTLETVPKEKNIDVHKELLKFHKRWYSANIMTLIVFGKESLDELEEMVIEKFSSVVDSDVTAPSWSSPYLKEHIGIKLNAVPVKDIRLLYIYFPIPDATELYKSDPLHYISHLLGHEGPGSLLSLLKSEGWCNNLSAGSHNSARGYGLFTLSLDLTETGIDQIDNIIELIFQYINLLKGEEGIQKWIFDELSSMLSTCFRFKDKEEPRSFVVNNVHSIQKYPMEKVLSIHYSLTEWRPDLIKEYLSYLTPENARAGVIAKKQESKCNQTEKWYGTKYSTEKLSEDLINTWKKCGLNEKLHLPSPNIFLPDNYDLVPPDAEIQKYPTIIKDTPIMRTWHKQDDEYLLPKLNCFFDFVSPLAYSDPLNTCFNAIFVLLFQDELTEFTYSAELACIYYSIFNNRQGLSIRLYGFNSKLHILLEKLIQKLVSFKVNPERLEIFKEVYVRELKNFEMQQPVHHSQFYLSMMLKDNAWSKKEYLDASKVITVKGLQEYIESFLSKLHVECFFHGNVSRKRAIELSEIVESKLPKNIIPLLPQQLLLSREIQLEKGTHYRFEVDQKIHSNSCILLYYQCGLQNTVSNVLLELIEQILREPCFNILRTKEQLGYMVFSNIRKNNGIQGYRIIVQSEKHPSFVDSRIEAFLNHMENVISNISAEEFEKYRQTLIAQKLRKPKMLLELSYNFRAEIIEQQYNFNRQEIEVDALKQITKDQLLEYYKELVAPSSSNRQKLGIHVISTAKDGAGNPDNTNKNLNKPNEIDSIIEHLAVPEEKSVIIKVDDIVSFRSERSLFPIIKSINNIPRKGASYCKL